MTREDALRIGGSAVVSALIPAGAAQLPDPGFDSDVVEWAVFLLVCLSPAAVALLFALPRVPVRGYLANGLAASLAMAVVSGIRLFLVNRSTLHEYSDRTAFQLGFLTILVPALAWVALLGGALALRRTMRRATR